MPTVIIRHDLVSARSLERDRTDLKVLSLDSKEDVVDELRDAEILVVNNSSWEDEFLDFMSAGDWVQTTSAGYDAFPLADFKEKGVFFTNGQGNHGPPVADHAMALSLALARGLPEFIDYQRNNNWHQTDGNHLIDFEDKTLVIAGLGDIGDCVARRAKGFGMEVYGTKWNPDTYAGCLPIDRVCPPRELTELLPRAELLILSVPLTDETYHLIDDESFAAMPESSFMINVCRGSVVNEEALIAALEEGEIAGAGIDAFEEEPLPPSSPLWSRNDVIITPHRAGRSASFEKRFADLFYHNYEKWIEGTDLKNRIA